jgi:endogenous inhibitor of DNA gyrase (YacG/DUF329 family)
MAKCPHCNKPVNLDPARKDSPDCRQVRKEVLGWIKKEIMYSCPHCETILGFGTYFGGWVTGRPR